MNSMTASVLKSFQDLYVSKLLHQSALLQAQVNNGIYTMKRTGMHIKRVAIAKKLHASEVSKLQEHELEKRERAQKDRMSQHVHGYVTVQSVLENLNANDLRFASELIDRVAEPLLSFQKELEVKLKKVSAQEEKLENSMRELRARIQAERKECAKLWVECSTAYRDWLRCVEDARKDAANKSTALKVEKAERNYQTKREKLAKAFSRFEQSCESATAEQRLYWTKELPMIVTTIELLEVERCNEFELRMNEFKRLEIEWQAAIPTIANSLESAFALMDVRKEMKSFVESAVVHSGLPVAPAPFSPALAAPSTTVQEDSAALHALFLSNSTGLAPAAPLAEKPSSAAPAASPASLSPSVGGLAGLSTSDPFNCASDPLVTYVKALYDFNSDDPDDLQFGFHSIIKVLLKGEDVELAAEVERGEADEPRWWRGVLLLPHGGFSSEGTFPSNYVVSVDCDVEVSLRHFLDIPSGFSCFSHFLRQEYSEENILFWSAVEKFRLAATQFSANPDEASDRCRQEMRGRAMEIAQEYIGGSAPRQVNINGSTAILVWERLNGQQISPNMFNEPQAEIVKVLAADSFTRFKRSELFTNYLNTKQAKLAI